MAMYWAEYKRRELKFICTHIYCICMNMGQIYLYTYILYMYEYGTNLSVHMYIIYV